MTTDNTDPALAENLEELLHIAGEIGADNAVIVRPAGDPAWLLTEHHQIPLRSDTSIRLILVLSFPTDDGARWPLEIRRPLARTTEHVGT
jgi:hypothetical protein